MFLQTVTKVVCQADYHTSSHSNSLHFCVGSDTQRFLKASSETQKHILNWK